MENNGAIRDLEEKKSLLFNQSFHKGLLNVIHNNINKCTTNWNAVLKSLKDFLDKVFAKLTSVVSKLDSWDILGS